MSEILKQGQDDAMRAGWLIGAGITITTSQDNDLVLNEPYVLDENRVDDNLTITLKQDEYFVLGDNRARSSDIVGEALVRVFEGGLKR